MSKLYRGRDGTLYSTGTSAYRSADESSELEAMTGGLHMWRAETGSFAHRTCTVVAASYFDARRKAAIRLGVSQYLVQVEMIRRSEYE